MKVIQNLETIWTNYCTTHAPFYGVIGRQTGAATFVILNAQLDLLFQTRTVFTRGNFSSSVRAGLRRHAIPYEPGTFPRECRTDNSLLALVRNLFTTATLQYYGQCYADGRRLAPTEYSEAPESAAFTRFKTQLRYLGYYLDEAAYQPSPDGLYPTYAAAINGLYTESGQQTYAAARAWVTQGFVDNVLPFTEDFQWVVTPGL